MEGPDLRGRGRPTLTGLRLAQGKQQVQAPVAPITEPRPKTAENCRISHCIRPEMGGQGLAPCTYPRWPPRN
jgi:hypothetical protein